MVDPLHDYHPIHRGTSAAVNVGTRERVATAAVGGALAAFGARLRSPIATPLLELAAAGLLYRAASGHCQVYDALGRRSVDDSRRSSLHPGSTPAAEPDPMAPEPASAATHQHASEQRAS